MPTGNPQVGEIWEYSLEHDYIVVIKVEEGTIQVQPLLEWSHMNIWPKNTFLHTFYFTMEEDPLTEALLTKVKALLHTLITYVVSETGEEGSDCMGTPHEGGVAFMRDLGFQHTEAVVGKVARWTKGSFILKPLVF